MSQIRDLRMRLEEPGVLDLWKAAAVKVRDMIEEKRCVYCWLNGYGPKERHSWMSCPKAPDDADFQSEKKSFKTAVRLQCFPKYKVHFMCYLPQAEPFHRAGFSYRQQCEWDDVVKDVMFLSMEIESLRPVFEEYEVEVKAGATATAIVAALVRERKGDVYSCAMQAIWAHIIIWRWMADEEDALT